jgi:hypothetical protein
MIKVSHLTKTFELTRQQRKELNTEERTAVAVDDISSVSYTHLRAHETG